jgi:hypothetical protein
MSDKSRETKKLGSLETPDIPSTTAYASSPSKEKGWRNWGDHPLIVVIGVVASAIAIITALASLPIHIIGSTPNIDEAFVVQANKDWQSTGITVRRGDLITIRDITGTWTIAAFVMPSNSFTETQNFTDYRGNPAWSLDYDPPTGKYANMGRLIAQIGNQNPFVVGNELEFEAQTSGSLSFRMNDRNFDNNDGSISLRIIVKRSQ